MSRELAVEVDDFSYWSDGGWVEAVLTRPVGHGPLPTVVVFPGTGRTAWELVFYTGELARHGFVVLTITQPGFGGSDGPWDFVGPHTIAVANEGIDRLRRKLFLGSQRLALFGVSTGAMLAALVAMRRDGVCATILASGVYDTATWFDNWSASASHEDVMATLAAVGSEGLPLAEALDSRSPIRLIDNLNCPVLIWHGGRDTISPPEQAYQLRDRLAQLGKPFETLFCPEAGHGRVPLEDVIPFLRKHLYDD